MASLTSSSLMFQSTPPRRGRLGTKASMLDSAKFQSTPPRRGRPWYRRLLDCSLWFQSTPPRRGRHDQFALGAHGLGVSIHAPAQGATFGRRGRGWHYHSFNPRPRAGGDIDASSSKYDLPKFQSTPPRRGRRSPFADYVGKHLFQSTPPRRGRPDDRIQPEPCGGVSIHAPAQGATGSTPRLPSGHDVSIHAPAQGATWNGSTTLAPSQFQSTPPRRGRPTTVQGAGQGSRFNPRPRAGGDPAAH